MKNQPNLIALNVVYSFNESMSEFLFHNHHEINKIFSLATDFVYLQYT